MSEEGWMPGAVQIQLAMAGGWPSVETLIRAAVEKAVAEHQATYLRDFQGWKEHEEARHAREVETLGAGLRAVEALMNESRGVVGLHLNGDEAPWDELRTGGRYDWLRDFDAALAALEVKP